MTLARHTAKHAAQLLRDALNTPRETAMVSLLAATSHITKPCAAIGAAKRAVRQFDSLKDRQQVLTAAIGCMEAAS